MPNKVIKKVEIVATKKFWSLIRKLFLIKLKFKKNKRPSNDPYITGDSFRNLCDHVYDEDSNFNEDDVKLGDLVFVSNPKILEYLQTKHRKIANPYILVEHNGDSPIDKQIADLLDDKIYKFYAQDVTYAHEKIVPIPIGFENLRIYVNAIPYILNKHRKLRDIYKNKKINKIFFNFSIGTNPTERAPAYKYFSQHPQMETIDFFAPSSMHFRILSKYKFVASPPGNAIESCRTWESLLVNTIPIVKDFASMVYFKKIGVPMWIVKNWNELDGLTEDDINRKYQELLPGANFEPLYMDYWKKEIQRDRENLMKKC